MDEALKRNVAERGTWLRGLYMVLFALIYQVAEIVMLAVVVFQFLTKLITGKTNVQLLAFGRSLSVFVYQIWRFLTFNSEEMPFPFAQWPDPAQGPEQRLLNRH